MTLFHRAPHRHSALEEFAVHSSIPADVVVISIDHGPQSLISGLLDRINNNIHVTVLSANEILFFLSHGIYGSRLIHSHLYSNTHLHSYV